MARDSVTPLSTEALRSLKTVTCEICGKTCNVRGFPNHHRACTVRALAEERLRGMVQSLGIQGEDLDNELTGMFRYLI